ncbi:MAG: UDP-N-acetylmuramoyl-L-alanyl-D-glutamate--2,6-diaminopimelate ligase [Rhizobacter sp.]|nr:UDP-N-acetylmuramoyl-L-alanyl-D-glutamate--2,6-diaminopimelate ligase [Bacteriovorax sp.]
MLKKELIELVSADIAARNSVTHLEHFITNITTNLQGAKHEDVIFYKVTRDEKSQENFHKRLATATPGLLILNHGAEAFIKNENCIFVDASRFLNIQKQILDILFPNKDKMKLIGVTGTNGKTTTVNLAMQISSMIGHPAIAVGTIGVQNAKGSLIDDLESTTPSYPEFRKLINKFQDDYEACFVEVSSHALEQGRLYDLVLDAAGWTSFSQDHLDYHKTMDEYFEAKLLVEKKYLREGKRLIVPKLEKELYQRILTSNANARVLVAKTLEERKISDKPLFYHSPYNQSNVEVALQLNADLWGEVKIQKIDLKKIETPKGRFSVIELENESMAIVDYAHTPDALVNIGAAIKKAFPNHSLTVVFGCGGNRDKTKRPLMAKAVNGFADKIIITSDNPRDEAPEDIVMDIIGGINSGYEAVIDRKKAILYALESMRVKEIVLIAGKGHEEYQEVKGVKHPFSDFDIVQNFKRG